MNAKGRKPIAPEGMTLEERNQNIIDLLDAHIPPKEIADLYGLAIRTIYKINWKTQDIRHKKEDRDKLIWEYTIIYGLTPKEIAQELGMNESTTYGRIDYILNKKGINKEGYKNTRKFIRSLWSKELEPDLASNPEIDIDVLIARFEEIKKLLNTEYQDDQVKPETEETFVLAMQLLSTHGYEFSQEDLYQLSYSILNGERTRTEANVEFAIRLLISQNEVYLATKLLEEFTTDEWHEDPATFKKRLLQEITIKRKEIESKKPEPALQFKPNQPSH